MYQGPDKIDSENQSSSTLLQLMFAKTLSHSVNSNRNNREEAKAKRPRNLVLQSFNWLYRLTGSLPISQEFSENLPNSHQSPASNPMEFMLALSLNLKSDDLGPENFSGN